MGASPENMDMMDLEGKGLATDGKLVLSSPKAPVKLISIHVLHRDSCCDAATRLRAKVCCIYSNLLYVTLMLCTHGDEYTQAGP